MTHFVTNTSSPSCTLCTYINKSIFSGLDQSNYHRIDGHKTCSEYKKGETIFYEGSRPFGIFCINKGKVKVVKNNSNGKEYILYLSNPGDFLGYRALFSEEFYTSNAIALEHSMVCFIPKDIFFELMQKNPLFMRKVVSRICREMGIEESRMADLANKSVRERVAASLLMLRETYGVEQEESVLIDLSLSRKDLSNIVGTATETLIHLLSEFKQDGIILLEGKKIRVLNSHKLAKYAGLLKNEKQISVIK